MFDINLKGPALNRLSLPALRAIEVLQSARELYVKPLAVQVQVLHERIGLIGGISTDRRGQYILESATAGRITIKRLQSLGFRYKKRGNGSHYWYRAGHTDFRNFFVALEEVTGQAI